MKAKPTKGTKYLNLTAYRGSIWFVRVVRGRRFRVDLETGSWEEAAARRDAYEQRKGVAQARGTVGRVPLFADAVSAALEDMDARRSAEAETGYSATTAQDRRRALREAGPILPHLGGRRLDTIDAGVMRRWHDAEVVARGRSLKTGENLLDAVEMVFRYARGRGQLEREHRPVAELRAAIGTERRTKRARATRDRTRRLARDGVLAPEEVGQLVGAARGEGLEALVVMLLAVECGLRRGELAGLTWGDVAWGTNEDDASRAILVRQARPRGAAVDAPKSGRERAPHVSRRLWRALRELYRARWEPGPETRIVERHYFDLDKVTLRRVLKTAGLPQRTFQNLRATCSSLLKQWGIAPEYVRAAIGHENDAVAREHYDRLDFRTYRPPEMLLPGETPMDLFARLCPERTPQESPQTRHSVAVTARKA